MYLGDIEVFRTSTAEPTRNGISWNYTKEMDQYMALWKNEQKIIFDLGNLVDDTYTGSFDTILVATFFTVPETRHTADVILPISTEQSGADQSSAFTVPTQNASISHTFPQNVEKAVISLSACGQIAEEFWYTNVFSSDVDTFESTAGTLNGFGPFREVQLLIDGQLAGVSWPFPVIFTGGVAPGLWRPIVSIDTFDLRQHEIDITPWLPSLCDGASHTFEIRVVGLNDDGYGHATLSETVGSYWVVTGTIFLFMGDDGSITTGSEQDIDALAPEVVISSAITTNSTGANQTLTYNTTVTRSISISSTIKSSRSSRLATWSQTLSYKNFNALTDQGFVQLTEQSTTGSDRSSSGYANTYSYPLTVNSSFSVDPAGGFVIQATLDRGLDYNMYGPSVFPNRIQVCNTTDSCSFVPAELITQENLDLPPKLPLLSGALLSTTQKGSAEYSSRPNNAYSFGTTEQDFDFKGAQLADPDATYELYHRHVKAVNSTVVEDEQAFTGQTFGVPVAAPRVAEAPEEIEGFSVRAVLGRGPGQAKPGL